MWNFQKNILKIGNLKIQSSTFVRTIEKNIQEKFGITQKWFEGVVFKNFLLPLSPMLMKMEKNQNFKNPKQNYCVDDWEENSGEVWKMSKVEGVAFEI